MGDTRWPDNDRGQEQSEPAVATGVPGVNLADPASHQDYSRMKAYSAKDEQSAMRLFPKANDLLCFEPGDQSGSKAETRGVDKNEAPSKAEMQQLVRDLGDNSFQVREAASAKLAALGERALPYLKEALMGSDLEAKRRATQLVSDQSKGYLSDNSVESWQAEMKKPADDKSDTPKLPGAEELPEILTTKMTQAEGKQRAAVLQQLAELEGLAGNKEKANALASQAKEWNDIDGTRKGITELTFRAGEKPEKALAQLDTLANLPNLKSLTVSDLDVDKALTDKLKNFKSVEELHLVRGEVKGDVLKGLKELPHLKSLDLTMMQITGDSLAPLKGFDKLEHLKIGKSFVTGEKLQHLKDIPNLKSVELTGALISSSGLKEVSQVKGLKSLNLSGSLWRAADLETLKDHANLERLDLTNSSFTEKGLTALGKLQNLKEVKLTDKDVSTTEVKTLSKSIPKTKIILEK